VNGGGGDNKQKKIKQTPTGRQIQQKTFNLRHGIQKGKKKRKKTKLVFPQRGRWGTKTENMPGFASDQM